MKRLLAISTILFLLVLLVGCRQNDMAAAEPDVADLYEEESHSPYEQADYLYGEEHEGCHHFHEQEEETHVQEQDDGTRIEVSWAPTEISFSSVEDFLNAYMIASAGREIDHLESEWSALFAPSELSSAEAVNFTALENVYLPMGIPDEFELFTIRVAEGGVVFIFMHPDDMVSEEAIRDALRNFRVVHFGFYRWDMDDDFLFDAMMEQSTERDVLIDGKYLFRDTAWLGYYSVDWISNRTRFVLQLPAQRNASGQRSAANEIGGVSLDDPYAMVSFTETATLNLQDTRAVEAMIEELEAARR